MVLCCWNENFFALENLKVKLSSSHLEIACFEGSAFWRVITFFLPNGKHLCHPFHSSDWLQTLIPCTYSKQIKIWETSPKISINQSFIVKLLLVKRLVWNHKKDPNKQIKEHNFQISVHFHDFCTVYFTFVMLCIFFDNK